MRYNFRESRIIPRIIDYEKDVSGENDITPMCSDSIRVIIITKCFEVMRVFSGTYFSDGRMCENITVDP